MGITDRLSMDHYEEVVVRSAVLPEVAEARGYRTLEKENAGELAELGFKPFVHGRDDAYPGLLIPMHSARGEVSGYQFKPATARTRVKGDGTHAPIKYESPTGAPLALDVPEFTRSVLDQVNIPLWITEGMKKTDSLVSQGLAALGLTGVFNWRNKLGTLGDWEEVPLKGRTVILCFDADAVSNRNVQLAMARLGAWLKTRGVVEVKYIVTPATVEGLETKGVDDFFAAGGTLATLAAVATAVAPGAGEKDASFTEAFLVEDLCDDALEGKFCWTSGLGWLRWNGKIWQDVSEVDPIEAVRQWATSQFEKVLSEQKKDPSRNFAAQIMGWRNTLSRAKIQSLVGLSRGIVQRSMEEFDADPDLITMENGTVHLPTGKLLPFDPAHSITKMGGCRYVAGATHEDWQAALSALPEGVLPWYQDRLGQALTGYKTPDHAMVLNHGDGGNGKSTIVNTVRSVMAQYGVQISDRVLMASPDAHPTELMDLRGARYAVLEETPEARHLNTQRLKMVLGTDHIKARKIRQDPVEFPATHSLFINTNYRPVVNETDYGTWRRLVMVSFPYTFKKRQEDVTLPNDRLGNPKLEYAHNDPDVRTAALAWMVQGAVAWYARDRMMLDTPQPVEASTLAWRAETDLVMGFLSESLEVSENGFVGAQVLLAAFNTWIEQLGHRPWNDKTFGTRFGTHEMTRSLRIESKRQYVDGRQQRGWAGVSILKSSNANPFTS